MDQAGRGAFGGVGGPFPGVAVVAPAAGWLKFIHAVCFSSAEVIRPRQPGRQHIRWQATTDQGSLWLRAVGFSPISTGVTRVVLWVGHLRLTCSTTEGKDRWISWSQTLYITLKHVDCCRCNGVNRLRERLHRRSALACVQWKRFHFLHVETRGIVGEGWTGRAGVLLQRLGQKGHQRHLFGTARGDGRSVQKTAFFLHLDKPEINTKNRQRCRADSCYI